MPKAAFAAAPSKAKALLVAAPAANDAAVAEAPRFVLVVGGTALLAAITFWLQASRSAFNLVLLAFKLFNSANWAFNFVLLALRLFISAELSITLVELLPSR